MDASMGNFGNGGKTVSLSSQRRDTQSSVDLLNRIDENGDALSRLDGVAGPLNTSEKRQILDLVHQGYSIDELIQIGDKNRSGWDHEVPNLLKALKSDREMHVKGQKQQTEEDALQILISGGPDDGGYEGGTYDDLKAAAPDGETAAIIDDIKNHSEELSKLDGVAGPMNQGELKNILELVKKGYDLDYLIDVGSKNNAGRSIIGIGFDSVNLSQILNESS